MKCFKNIWCFHFSYLFSYHSWCGSCLLFNCWRLGGLNWSSSRGFSDRCNSNWCRFGLSRWWLLCLFRFLLLLFYLNWSIILVIIWIVIHHLLLYFHRWLLLISLCIVASSLSKALSSSLKWHQILSLIKCISSLLGFLSNSCCIWPHFRQHFWKEKL